MSGTTLRELLSQSVATLKLANVPSPEVDARELLQRALGLSRVALLTRAAEVVVEADAAKVADLVARRAARIPLQHLLGEVEWGGVRLKVDGRALVPRPETEVLLELALRVAEGWLAPSLSTSHKPRAKSILDIGTGTGALALGLKNALPDADVWACDISGEALALARENAALNGLDVHFVPSDLLGAFLQLGQPRPVFDLIVSNPPYLPAADRETADPEVQHDPELALYAGDDGLALARPLVAEAWQVLLPGGTLLLELDPRNVEQLAGEMQGWHSEILCDLTGRQRFLRAVRAG
ncbi:peptide chain release factor N(5)-glutamine methyltransferase [Deinococcus sp.]|uniref:peptide chain release factor N(5)-glutamine methyltransferase n=1 Tax=Deinococcus sp. TaxID=47478 RepID=UPI0025C59797|nr:peptide chain release factor N(5)-glutamine methyltransferase [Deinococcus sp.]